MASNQLLYEANKLLKEFKNLNSTPNFEPPSIREERLYFVSDRIMNLAISEIDKKRRKEIEARGRRFYYSDGYNPRWVTKNRVRNFLITELHNEPISKDNVGVDGRVCTTEQS